MPVFERQRAFHERGPRDGGDFFTRETWRRGRRSRLRKRTKPYGGRKTAPPAFLEAAKNNRNSNPVDPAVGFAARSNAMDAHADDWP